MATESKYHYPLALSEQIAKRIAWAKRMGEPVLGETISRINDMLAIPVNQYRPLPAARKFHQSPKHFRWCIGGNRCLGPDQKVNGIPVSRINGTFTVQAWDGESLVNAPALAPFIKGREMCYRIYLSNGETLDCSLNHHVLTLDGTYASVGEVLCECVPCLQASISGTDQQDHLSDGPRWTRAISDSPADCPRDCRLCGESLPPEEGIAPDASPLPDDARTHISSVVSWRTDGRGNRHAHIPVPSPISHPSIQDGPCRNVVLSGVSESRTTDTTVQSADLNSRSCPQHADVSILREAACVSSESAIYVRYLSRALFSPYAGYVYIVAFEEIGVKDIYDFEVPGLHNYFAAGIISHNSSKSHSVAHEVYWHATGTHPWKSIKVPNTGWYATITWDMVGTILWDKMRLLMSHMLEGQEYSIIWHNRNRGIPAIIKLRVNNDPDWQEDGHCSKIIFKAYEQGADSFQGTERRYVGLDEQFPEGVFLEVISRIGAGEPLDFFTAMTPIKSQPWLEEVLTTEVPDTWDVFEYPLDDNKISRGGFIPDETIDALIAEWPDEVVETRRMGRWASFMGQVYKAFSRNMHVVKESDEHLFLTQTKDGQNIVPHQLRIAGSVDWGGANPLAFVWMVKLPHLDGAWYVFDEYYWNNRTQGLRLLKDHAAAILNRTKNRWHTSLFKVWADHDCQDRFEFQASGIPSLPANKDVTLGIETVQKYMKVREDTGRPRFFVAERCRNTIRELVGLHWPDKTETRDPKDVPVDIDDHAADCVRYVVFSEEASVPGKLPDTKGKFKRTF